MSGFYDVALICLNGHVVNDSSRSRPQHNQKYCDKCGESTISKCTKCGTDIRGDYHVPSVVVMSGMSTPPRYCHECGTAYPWTERALNAANDIAGAIDSLSSDERRELQSSFPDLIKESPQTEVAKLKFKKLMRKVGDESYQAVKSVLISAVSEAVKKAIF